MRMDIRFPERRLGLLVDGESDEAKRTFRHCAEEDMGLLKALCKARGLPEDGWLLALSLAREMYPLRDNGRPVKWNQFMLALLAFQVYLVAGAIADRKGRKPDDPNRLKGLRSEACRHLSSKPPWASESVETLRQKAIQGRKSKWFKVVEYAFAYIVETGTLHERGWFLPDLTGL